MRLKTLIILSFLIAVVLCLVTASYGQNEHIWLHVEGKYIRKSPYCTDPNGIWMGCGAAHRNQGFSGGGTGIVAESLSQWIKDQGSNLVRILGFTSGFFSRK